MKKNSLRLVLVFALLFSNFLQAYEFNQRDFLLRAVGGASVNVVRESISFGRMNFSSTPAAGALISLELEYMLDNTWAISGGIRPVFAPGAVDLGFSAGAKYRWASVSVPFKPFVGFALTPAVLLPTGHGDNNINLGLRVSFGCDYFVLRDFTVGVEFAMEPSFILVGASKDFFEFSVDLLIGFTWRI